MNEHDLIIQLTAYVGMLKMGTPHGSIDGESVIRQAIDRITQLEAQLVQAERVIQACTKSTFNLKIEHAKYQKMYPITQEKKDG